MSRNSLIAEIDSMVSARQLLRHPFYQEWSAGRLPLDALRSYAAQYYRHVELFPRYLSALHCRCQDLHSRQALLENLIDEERGPDNHPELWLRFAEGLGLSREQVLGATALASTRRLVETFTRLSCKEPIEAGFAALYVYESQIPETAAAKIQGLRHHYGITDRRSLSFFTVHKNADVLHAQVCAEMLERHARGLNAKTSVLKGTELALAALWEMLDGVHASNGPQG